MDSLKLSRARSSKIQVCSKTSRYHLIVSSGSLLWLLFLVSDPQQLLRHYCHLQVTGGACGPEETIFLSFTQTK